MADNNSRSYPSRDPFTHGGDRAPARGPTTDPLAELARLIGQRDPVDDFSRDTVSGAGAAVYDPATDDRYAEPNDPAQEGYQEGYQQEGYSERQEDGYDERYDPPRLADPQAYRAPPSVRDVNYEAPAPQFSPPRLNSARDNARSYAVEPPRYREEPAPPEAHHRQLPAFLPRSRDDRYEYDEHEQDGADDQAYASEDYEEETPNGRRRSGFVVVAAVLGLAVLGTAGAFAYRAMFGSAMLPSLPPIIRADTGPNKIVPSASKSQGSNSAQAGANSAGSGEKLVSREENPVDVPAPVGPAPRVVSTIPIFPAPDNPGAGALASGAPTSPPPAVPAPFAVAAPIPSAAGAPVTLPTAVGEPRKIHTVAIRPDQSNGTDTAAPAPPSRATATRPPAPTAARPAAAPAPQAGGNAPLSIVPSQGSEPAAAPVRTRTAMTQPTSISPSAGGEQSSAAAGGYAVQVTSQRSEAEAQAEFRTLRAKYPSQLGGHEPIIRQVDLGAKGVYYRALVGPYASAEQAAGICSSLKAAGGNCLVQKN